MGLFKVAVVACFVSLPQLAQGYCDGLMVGTRPGRHDVVSNGETVRPFTLESPPGPKNAFSSEDDATTFYFRKLGQPVNVQAILHHASPSDTALMRPEVEGTFDEKQRLSHSNYGRLDDSSSSVRVNYHCSDYGGNSNVWLQIRIDSVDAARACGDDGEPKDILIMWTKYCKQNVQRESIHQAEQPKVSIGWTQGGSEVVKAGVVQPAWKVDTDSTNLANDAIVYSSTVQSRFWIYTNGATQVFGAPKIKTDDTKVVVSLGSALQGGIATATPQELDISYLCDKNAMEAVEVELTIDLCPDNVNSAECTEAASFGYKPIQIHYVKNCGLADGSFWFSDIIVMFVLAGAILCIFGCCFNYSVKNKRGIDVIPGGRYLEKLAERIQGISRPTGHIGVYRPTRQAEPSDNGITIGQTQSSTGVVTVHFDSGGAVPSAYQSNEKEEGADFDEADF